MAITDDGCFESDKRMKDPDGENNLLEWSSVEEMEA